MRNILQHRGLRLIFAANLISMVGSGMNSAGVTWFVLQKTHSEMALGTLLMLQTIPTLLILPFSGVVIDREDRRRLLMGLDAIRGLIILVVAVLAYRGMAALWEVYLMNILVAAGFWMFWPTITALIQELTPDSQFVHSNSFLLAGVQAGWLVAGAIVGFVYNKIGLAGVLFIDFASYVLSFTCYLFVRKGRHIVAVTAETIVHENALAKFQHELKEGIAYIRLRPRLLLLGIAWALFVGGMLTQGVITAPFSDRILKAGAVGYGWLNTGWATGACLGAIYTPMLLRGRGHRRAVGISMALIGLSLLALPVLGTHLHGSLKLSASFTVGRGIGGLRDGLLPDGIVPRPGRRGHYQHYDGFGAQALYGTRAEHLLFPGDNLSAGVLVCGRNRVAYQRPGEGIRNCSRHLSAGMPGWVVAGGGISGGTANSASAG